MALDDELELREHVPGVDNEPAGVTPDPLEIVERQGDRRETTDVGAFADGVEHLVLEHRPQVPDAFVQAPEEELVLRILVLGHLIQQRRSRVRGFGRLVLASPGMSSDAPRTVTKRCTRAPGPYVRARTGSSPSWPRHSA